MVISFEEEEFIGIGAIGGFKDSRQ